MSFEFDDEKLADDKSVAQMQANYARVGAQRTKVLQTERSEPDISEAANGVGRTGTYLGFLQDLTSGDDRQYMQRLIEVNDAELQDLRANYDSLRDFDRTNPERICRPSSRLVTNRNLARNEIATIRGLFDVYASETRPETRALLERIIRRRLESLNSIFLRQNWRLC